MALYNAMVKSKRQQFHRRVAEVLEAAFPQTAETQPELLGHHFTEAGLTEKAVDYWLKAGVRSRERSAESEAIGNLSRGLALLETLHESPERDARELAIVCALGAAYIASRGYSADGVGPVFARARELSERVGQPPQVFASMFGSWVFHFTRGDFRRCTELANEGMEFANRLGDRGIVMEALKWVGQTMLYRADFAGARDRLAMAVDQYDSPENKRDWAAYTNTDPRVANRCHLAMSLWHLGFPDQALTTNREMRKLARAIRHPFTLAYALHHTGLLQQCCRLGVDVQAAGEESFAISTDQGFAWWTASGTFYKGAGLLLQGQLEEAIPLIRKGVNACARDWRRADPSGPAQRPGRRLHAGRPVRGRARGAGRGTGNRGEERRALPGGRAAPPERRAVAGGIARPGRCCGRMLPPRHRDRPTAAEPGLGAAGHNEPCPALATARPSRRGPRRAGGRLRHVHGRFHDAGPRGGWVAAASSGLRSIPARAAHFRRLS